MYRRLWVRDWQLIKKKVFVLFTGEWLFVGDINLDKKKKPQR